MADTPHSSNNTYVGTYTCDEYLPLPYESNLDSN